VDADFIEGNAVFSANQAAKDDSEVQCHVEVENVVADRASDSSHERQESEAIRILQLQIELEKNQAAAVASRNEYRQC
jgi:hypothetical protein